MWRITLAYCAIVLAWAGSGSADESGKSIAEGVRKLRADTVWRAVREIPLQFDAYHPQGMAIVKGEFWVSSVEVVDRAEGKGNVHLFRIDELGAAQEHFTFRGGPRYHPGGIDFDGKYLWFPVAEYRPQSTSEVWRIEPKTMEVQPIRKSGAVNDHLGALAYDADSQLLIGVSWGSRYFYRWTPRDAEVAGIELDSMGPRIENRSHFIDLQDAQWLAGTALMLCGGLRNYRGPKGEFALGGLELIDMGTLTPVHQVPVPVWEPGGRPMTQNAFAAEAAGAGLRFYFLPGDGRAAIYVYEPEIGGK